MPILEMVIALLVGLALGAAIFIPVGIARRKATAEREIGSAEEEAKRILNEAIKSAESKKREALVEAKEEILKAKNENEREMKERRSELNKQEHRLQQKEENLDRKTDAIERKEEKLSAKLAEAERTQEEAERLKKSELEVLERISGFTAEEAKNYLISQLESEVTHESAMKVKEIEAHFKEEADTYAREMIALAIQRCAADHVAEVTVSVVPLPNDEMKGRIIGREGRNIRTLETLTGAELIIDDTPEAITVSCFDPVRREITRIALERLIADGRIHPARIEEMVEKAKREVDATIKAEGERAIFETNVHGLHPELVKLLGRQRYRTSYGQNVLNHSIEVAHIAGLLAAEIGADVTLAKRAGLLHDHCRPPQRRGAPDHHRLPGAGGGCHLRRPARRPAGESGELYQAAGEAGGDLLLLQGCGQGLRHPGGPGDPGHGQARGGQRGPDGAAGPGHCQADRGRAGVPRTDQGQCAAGNQGRGVRQINRATSRRRETKVSRRRLLWKRKSLPQNRLCLKRCTKTWQGTCERLRPQARFAAQPSGGDSVKGGR